MMEHYAERGVEQNELNEEQSNLSVAYRKIEELEQYGINKTDITKLKSGGYHTIEAIAHGSLRKLTEVKGISEQKAQKLKEIIKTNQLVSIGFQTASSRLEIMKDMIMISTGSNDLDVLLGGYIILF